MSGTIPKTKLHSVGECPECGGKMFEEVAEKSYGLPDHEVVYYEKFLGCADCPHTEEYDPGEPDEIDFE